MGERSAQSKPQFASARIEEMAATEQPIAPRLRQHDCGDAATIAQGRPLIEEAKFVPSDAVDLMDLQDQSYT
ncbi:hypothetical protein [Thioclava indica]|uniref:Uncharacterized protein n=1 Tax=Thioclava indica TaxID=1353528 RepID=A0A074JIW6_9RHOB|nr:hypothetical protein [Thioclava indica]KEO57551.1 hypothetical protein DT23_05625 [Thioclava indica]